MGEHVPGREAAKLKRAERFSAGDSVKAWAFKGGGGGSGEDGEDYDSGCGGLSGAVPGSKAAGSLPGTF